MMRISQLATYAGVPASTLRFYDGAGLLPAERSPAGYRLYGQRAVERLAFIGEAKHLGLGLEEIAELLEVWEGGVCAEVKAALRPRIATHVTQAETRRARMGAFIGELHRALEHLDTMPDRTEPCDAECGLSLPPASGPERWRLAPVACSLGEEEVEPRAAQWHALLADAERHAIPDGVRLSVPAGRAGELAALCAAEQECCPFLDFVIHLDGPLVHLEVRAPAGASDLLEGLLAVENGGGAGDAARG